MHSGGFLAMGNAPSGDGLRSRRPLRLVVIEVSRWPQLMGYLEDYPVEILGLADLDIGSAVMIQAKNKGIFVTQDYTRLLELGDLELIINLSPDKTVQMVVDQLKPEGAGVVHLSQRAFLTAPLRERILSREITEILKQLAKCISGVSGIREALKEVFKGMMFICRAQAAGLWLRQGDAFVLFFQEGLPESLGSHPGAQMGEGVLQILLQERRAVVVRDLKTQADFPDREIFMASGINALIMLPVIRDGELTAAFSLMLPRPVPEELEILTEILQAVAGLLAETLERAGKAWESKELSTRDELTELHNEAYLLDRLEEQIAQAWRKGGFFSLLCIKMLSAESIGSRDISTMPRVMRSSARQVRSSIRKMDVAARSKQGDLFLILPEADPTEALKIGKRILAKLNQLHSKELQGAPINYAVGLASFPEHGTGSKELLSRAAWAALGAGKEAPANIMDYTKAHPGAFLPHPHEIVKIFPSLEEVFRLLWEVWETQEESWSHSRGVAYYAGRIGQSLGLDERSVLHLQISGWLHDLGKMGIFFPKGSFPEHFPRLAQVEQEIHAAVGAFILRHFISTESILKGVFHHHDRFNSACKPNGLTGESIPLEGRILALADAYEHLLVQTKLTEGPQGVFSKLRETAGKTLDPQLVECLIRSEAEALDLRQQGWALPSRKKSRPQRWF